MLLRITETAGTSFQVDMYRFKVHMKWGVFSSHAYIGVCAKKSAGLCFSFGGRLSRKQLGFEKGLASLNFQGNVFETEVRYRHSTSLGEVTGRQLCFQRPDS
ncbi:UNVERIFIED_CONTAM: hypothetical protein K2H54_025784 [Gekko kuhli]